MSWRIVKISSHCKLRLSQNSFIYEPDPPAEKVSFALEDIAIVILESQQINITSALLSKLSDYGVTVITCDEKHKPNGILCSYGKPSKQSEVVFKQTEMSLPLQKRLWQAIIRQKIFNQATVLLIGRKAASEYLYAMAAHVLSGDGDNKESLAAQNYWKNLFPEGFVRHNEDGINAALNYGYAIIRNVLIENIAVSGLIGCLGVNHHSVLNNFNLADDLIEPYRPFVDLVVLNEGVTLTDTLSEERKELLIAILQQRCFISGKETTILNALRQTVYSFISAIKENDASQLILPNFKLDD
jgi:CRISPR-associated protein Cas1